VIPARWVALGRAVAATVVLAGCAGARIVDGVYHSPKGYRVAVPSLEWTLTTRGRADVELRHRTEPVGMLVHATCSDGPSQATLDVLARHLLVGLRDRSVVSAEEISLNGKVARHAVVDGRLGDDGELVRVELYVVRGMRCVYDLLYAASPASFDDWRPGFQRFVETFHTE
jgi:hypothetical protein